MVQYYYKACFIIILLLLLAGCSDGVTNTDIPQNYVEILSINDNKTSIHRVALDTYFENTWFSDHVNLKAISPSYFALASYDNTVTIDTKEFIVAKELNYNINSPDIPLVQVAPWHRINISKEPIEYKGLSSSPFITDLIVQELIFKGPESINFNTILQLKAERPRPNRFLKHIIYKTTEQLSKRYLFGNRITLELVTDSLQKQLHVNQFYREYEIFEKSADPDDKFELAARFKPNLPYKKIKFGRGLLGIAQERYVFFESVNHDLYMHDLNQNTTTQIGQNLIHSSADELSYTISEHGIYYTSSGKIKFYDVTKERSEIIHNPDRSITDASLHYDTKSGRVFILHTGNITEDSRYVETVICSVYNPKTRSVTELFSNKNSPGSTLISNFIEINGTFYTAISVKQ